LELFIGKNFILWSYFLVTYLCFLSFWHSSLFIFKVTENTRKTERLILKLLSIFLWNLVPYYFFFAVEQFNEYLLPVGIVLSLISLLVYWLSVKSLNGYKLAAIHGNIDNNKIFAKGIYKYIRHPFYTSYLICYIGVGLCLPNPLVVLVSCILFVVYVYAALKEEKGFLRSELKHEYIEYKKNSGMFLPKKL